MFSNAAPVPVPAQKTFELAGELLPGRSPVAEPLVQQSRERRIDADLLRIQPGARHAFTRASDQLGRLVGVRVHEPLGLRHVPLGGGDDHIGAGLAVEVDAHSLRDLVEPALREHVPQVVEHLAAAVNGVPQVGDELCVRHPAPERHAQGATELQQDVLIDDDAGSRDAQTTVPGVDNGPHHPLERRGGPRRPRPVEIDIFVRGRR